MADDPFVMWTNVPAGSTFKLKCDGSKTTYDFVALVSKNGLPEPNIEIDEVNPGPAKRDIAKKDKWIISPTVIVTKKLTKAITLSASVEKDGKVVLVPDGSGGKMPAQEDWQSGKTASPAKNDASNMHTAAARCEGGT